MILVLMQYKKIELQSTWVYALILYIDQSETYTVD